MSLWKTNGPWVYLIAFMEEDQLRRLNQLNRYGSDGWELVSITRDMDGHAVAYFKKPR